MDLDLEDLALREESYKHFIRSPATQIGYKNSLKRYLAFLRLKDLDESLPTCPNSNSRHTESQIISHIMHLRERGIAYYTIHFLVAPIFTFYQLNDVTLNRKKVSRYLGEYERVARDGAYTREQIQIMLQNADSCLSMIIQILNSTACRIEHIEEMRNRSLKYAKDHHFEV